MALLVAAVFACSACASSPPADATPSPRQGDVVYVSIGDSYAAGEQLSAFSFFFPASPPNVRAHWVHTGPCC